MSELHLVAGGSGFIGSHIVEGLLAAGHQVRVLDNLATGYLKNLAGLDCEIIQADAADKEAAADACKGVSNIFHLAARPSVPWSFEEPRLARHANLGTTEALIYAAEKQGVKRILFSSSSAIYGDSPELPKTEDMEPAPKSPYAEHKLFGEYALAEAAERFGLESVSLRYFNVFGPRQDPSSPYSGVISLFARWLKEGTPPTFFGDGKQTRDFIYVKDVVKANLAAGQVQLSQSARIINVACGKRVDLLELWDTMCRVGGFTGGEPIFQKERKGDVRHSLADIQRAQEELGFQADFALEEGLRRTICSL
ncbi:MAG: NAD-dependent epimerase/dehydratase family protein [Planctomycetota bacterium]|nr:NAD-dependent epimerase/dehydratase family protein [Planctomycetota bacterium]MDA1114747.1 NAD-dependent epimerase/dehydratase family protein [Planctomycetota bacterium]